MDAASHKVFNIPIFQWDNKLHGNRKEYIEKLKKIGVVFEIIRMEHTDIRKVQIFLYYDKLKHTD